MEREEAEKLFEEKLEKAKADWMKTRGWRHDRWESIKRDPQASAILIGVGLAAPTLYGWGQKFLALVL